MRRQNFETILLCVASAAAPRRGLRDSPGDGHDGVLGPQRAWTHGRLRAGLADVGDRDAGALPAAHEHRVLLAALSGAGLEARLRVPPPPVLRVLRPLPLVSRSP